MSWKYSSKAIFKAIAKATAPLKPPKIRTIAYKI